MHIQHLLAQLENLNPNQQKDLAEKLQQIIDNEYVSKTKVAELQKQINILVQENNEKNHQIAVRFSKQEHQTMAFQLGKNIIDVVKGEKTVKSIPKIGLNLFTESIRRKNKKELNGFQKNIATILEYKDALNEKKVKSVLIDVLNSAIQKLNSDDDEQKKQSYVDSTYVEVEQNALKIPELVSLSPQVIIKNELKETEKSSEEKLKIACIMDEFTYFCFSPEAKLLQLSPENWLDEIVAFKPDILFVESAWQGKESLWKAKVSQNSSEVISLINYCRINSVKTLFWNKEDPVHFGTFIDVAKQVDVVFTTDIDCIGRYKAEVGHENVYLMPFAAQPKTHNPIEKYVRKDAVNFAGSFYLKYPERQRDFVTLTDVASKFKVLEIYDRNFNNDHPHYKFPEKYHPYILGRLEPHEIDKAYKGYVYGINMNTIKQSQSMFARRVFEMLASNTIVLSNYSRGVRNFFGDLVLCSDNFNELENKLGQIVHDKNLVDKFKLLGLRKVLSEHTYEDRMEYILSKLKIEAQQNKYKVAIVAKVEDQQSLEKIITMFNEQDYQDKLLFIFNPQHIKFDAKENIINCVTLQDIEEKLKSSLVDYISFFTAENYYLSFYITDLVLSFKFLKFQDVAVATKASYYTFKGEICLNEGIEYQYVNDFTLNRSIIYAKYFFDHLNLLEQFFKNTACSYKDQAFAIDRFNFVENSNMLTEKDLSVVSSTLENLDLGVELKANLLPYAENITAFASQKDQKIVFNAEYFEQNVVSNNKFIQVDKVDDKFIIQSQLDAKQHRYLLLASKLTKISNKIALQLNADTDFDTQVVAEFYNTKDEKVGFKIFQVSEFNKIELSHDTAYFNISVRLKGAGRTITHSLDYIVYGQEKSLTEQSKNESLTVLNADVFKIGLVKGSSKQIQFINNQPEKMLIRTTLAPTKHCYLYLKDVFTRDEINLVLNSEFELDATTTAEDVRIVFEFQDENKVKISHSMNPILGGHALAIPMHCKYVRIGFKIVGQGETEIKCLSFGTVKNPVHDFIPKSDVLVIAKQYPSYDDLYKYGFLHTRLRAYKKENRAVDMFRVTLDSTSFGFSEFEGIDIFSHNHAMLDKLLASGVYKKVCIHLMDNKMWDVVKKYQDTVQIIIWVHGAEIRSWKRRSFENALLDSVAVERQKKLSINRTKFWLNLLNNELKPNTQFVFVSKYFLKESEEDLGVKFPEKQCHIIHNFINSDQFNYVEKTAEDRFKVLSIRPFANLGYANDLTVKTILELSKYPEFKQFSFTICGDGELFDETVAPLIQFNNVKLIKGFLTHQQISALHKKHGVFLVPTRIDSQGVSRDEAMSSGLVPVTNGVSAVPEFVDNDCGIVVAADDWKAMADGLIKLAKSPETYRLLSQNSVKRAKSQSSYDLTVKKELALFV